MSALDAYQENSVAYAHARWRLLNTGVADGASNMAIDAAILRAVARQLVPATLRLYAWEPPCLSLGQAQSFSEVDWAACVARGTTVVRRPTGGRAILHTDELTYSVTAPETEPRVQGGIVESYRRLSEGLLEGLRLMGVPGIEAHRPEVEVSRSSSSSSQGPVCFEVPSTYEITVAGKKLVGSAQVRREGVVLQHGTLPLVGDIARICDVLISHPDPARVRARAATVESVLGRAVSFDEAAMAVARGMVSVLNLELEPGDLTPQERAWADELRLAQYAADEWNRRL
jgi:lipoate-protein ligase A